MDILAGGVEEIPPELLEPLRVARMRMSGPLFSWVLGFDAQVVGDKWVLLSVAGACLTCSGYSPPQWFNFNLRAIARDSTYLGQGQFPAGCFQFNLIDDPLREKTTGGQPTTARTG